MTSRFAMGRTRECYVILRRVCRGCWGCWGCWGTYSTPVPHEPQGVSGVYSTPDPHGGGVWKPLSSGVFIRVKHLKNVFKGLKGVFKERGIK